MTPPKTQIWCLLTSSLKTRNFVKIEFRFSSMKLKITLFPGVILVNSFPFSQFCSEWLHCKFIVSSYREWEGCIILRHIFLCEGMFLSLPAKSLADLKRMYLVYSNIFFFSLRVIDLWSFQEIETTKNWMTISLTNDCVCVTCYLESAM